MKCLVVGPGKSGTTALFYSIAEHVPDAELVFEPPIIQTSHLEHEKLVVKKLVEVGVPAEDALIPRFEKRIYICRDPRDSVVSRLVYNLWDRRFIYDENKLAQFIDKLKEKEADPARISVIRLFKLIDELEGVKMLLDINRINKMATAFLRRHRDLFFLLKYEDYVDDKLEAVSEYLGMSLTNDPQLPSDLSRVRRTKSKSDWKNWFTPEDIDYFREAFAHIMDAYGYDDEWEINSNQMIRKEFCTEYVKRLLEMRLG